MLLRATAASFCVLVASLLSGCGGGSDFNVAPVSGKVLCGGEPVTAGMITFTPIAEGDNVPGKPAAAMIEPDGTFVLTTYERGDGAVIGKHNVTYEPPMTGEGGEEEDEEGNMASSSPPPVQKHACRFGGQATAEVKDEDNVLTIELSPTGPGARMAPGED